MKQIIHIFKKDVRHHWLEIVLCQAALLGYVWHELHGWEADEIYLGFARFLPSAIISILPIAWWLFIFRVVQGESLVGDRQFWVTRPYEWKKLLAAKVLMILVFINLPIFCAQLFFLAKAHFTPLPYLFGLLCMQLMLVLFPFLPIMAMAAVTRNIAQGLLGLLGVSLFVAGMLALDTYLPTFAMADVYVSDWMQGALVVIACAMVVWVQFKWRKTARARLFLASAPAALLILFFAAPLFIHAENDYPSPSGGSVPFSVASYGKPTAPKIPADNDEDVNITVPVVTTGLQAGYVARITSAQLRLETKDGMHWDSKWQGAYDFFFPGQLAWAQDFTMSYKDFEKLKSFRFKATISFKVEIFQDRGAQQIKAGKGEFEIPHVGLCHVDTRRFNSIECHSPLVKPEIALIQLQYADSTCPVLQNKKEDQDDDDSAPQVPLRGSAYDWELNGDERPAEYGINPVESFTLYFKERAKYSEHVRICPGTPLMLSFPVSVQRTRAEFEINQFNLEEYRKEPFRISSWGIALRR